MCLIMVLIAGEILTLSLLAILPGLVSLPQYWPVLWSIPGNPQNVKMSGICIMLDFRFNLFFLPLYKSTSPTPCLSSRPLKVDSFTVRASIWFLTSLRSGPLSLQGCLQHWIVGSTMQCHPTPGSN